MKFLHCMREKAYLESALREGLMLTNHDVNFALSDNHDDMNSFLKKVFPLLNRKLASLGKSWEAMSDQDKQIILMGIGSVSATIPMICFSEVREGQNICNQRLQFGAYGLVVRREWLERQRADRVIYVGQNSSVSQYLHKNISNLRILSLGLNESESVIFDSNCLRELLDLLAYVEVRENLEEVEWRIVGAHGLMGGNREVGQKLPVQLDDLEYVLVKTPDEVGDMQKRIRELAESVRPSATPEVLCQPSEIPF